MLTVHVPRLPYFLTIAYLAADILVELAEMTGCVGIEWSVCGLTELRTLSKFLLKSLAGTCQIG